MESDLFGGSLGKKTTPQKPAKSTKTASEPKKINTDNEHPPSADSTRAKSSSPSTSKSMLHPVGIVNKIIITLLKSQIILAEHECSTNWGDCKSNKSNQMLVFEERGKPEYPEKNLSEQSREPTNSAHI